MGLFTKNGLIKSTKENLCLYELLLLALEKIEPVCKKCMARENCNPDCPFYKKTGHSPDFKKESKEKE